MKIINVDDDAVPKAQAEVNSWYLLQLKPRGFQRAVSNLQRQSVRTFMPLCPLSDVNRTALLQPLFPGYLFASFNPLQLSFTTINSTFGVANIVTTGCDVLHGLPSGLIEGLQARCDLHGHLMPLDDLDVNETVRIIGGPFAQFVARVDRLSGSDRVKVLFEIMGQTVRSEISINDLERVDPS